MAAILVGSVHGAHLTKCFVRGTAHVIRPVSAINNQVDLDMSSVGKTLIAHRLGPSDAFLLLLGSVAGMCGIC